MKIHCLYDSLVAVNKLKPHPKNRNKHPDEQITRLAEILEYQGWRYPIKVSKRSGFITSGHGRLEAAKKLGLKEVPVNFQEYDSEEQEYADLTADNAIALWAEIDFAAINADLPDLGPELNIDMLGIKDFILEPADKNNGNEAKPTMADKFMLPPFTVLNAREGWWQDRKRQWLSLGIKSELGRGGGQVSTIQDAEWMQSKLGKTQAPQSALSRQTKKQ